MGAAVNEAVAEKSQAEMSPLRDADCISNRRTVWLAAIAVMSGIAARLWLWWFTIGSNDTSIWNDHAKHILKFGVAGTYRNFQAPPQFNHPPPMALYAAQARLWAHGNLLDFGRLIKLPGLFGEALAMWALWRFAGRRAFAVYAMLPVAILISGYHGNTDCLYAALVLVAVIAFDREKYFLAGVLFGLALNVKLLPLIVIPLAFLAVSSWRQLWKLAAGLTIPLLTFVPPALTAGHAMFHNMLQYDSRPENWGVMAILNAGMKSQMWGGLSEFALAKWIATGRYRLILAMVGIVLLSMLRRKMSLSEQATLMVAVFFLVAPGFAVQYLIFIAPLLCLVDWKIGAWWGWTAGLFAGVVYLSYVVSWTPLRSEFWGFYPFPANVLSILPCGVLVYFIVARLRLRTCAGPVNADPARP